MSVKIYLGPMCSGKSTSLARDLNRLSGQGYSALYLNSVLDTRDEGSDISTNSPDKIKLYCPSKKVKNLLEVDVEEYFAIGIDEAQFFSDLPETVRKWRDMGKHIFIAGLDGDYRQKPFGRVLETIPLCDANKLFKLEALCVYCKNEKKGAMDASYTRKKIIPTMAKSTDGIIDIGGTDKYVPVCWGHLKD
jgi:thymidine kinase